MAPAVKSLSYNSLFNPIYVRVNKSMLLPPNVSHEIEYVKPGSKKDELRKCLIKSSPPILIFSNLKSDVEELYEFLTSVYIKSTFIHSGKSQSDREEAIRLFSTGDCPILIATDLLSKGIDIPGIKHVINFDLPEYIEDYIHRVGRTGRSKNKGVATTFIDRESPETALLDLKYLLTESGQNVPPSLIRLLHKTDSISVSATNFDKV